MYGKITKKIGGRVFTVSSTNKPSEAAAELCRKRIGEIIREK